MVYQKPHRTKILNGTETGRQKESALLLRPSRPVEPLRRETTECRPTALRLRRAAKRQATHGLARDDAGQGLLTFLEVNSVKSGTAGLYNKVLNDFYLWMKDVDMEFETWDELDQLVCEYLEHLYFQGYNHDVGDKVVAALRYSSPCLTGLGKCVMLRAQRSLRGFKRLAPGSSRAPLPYLGIMAMIGAAFHVQAGPFGMALLTQFIGYLRPNELLTLSIRNLVKPTLRAPNVWGILIAPEELHIRSKTQAFDESVTIDWKTPAISMWYRKLTIGRKLDDSLFSLCYVQFNKLFGRMAEISGVSDLRPHPYSVRHGGASHDYLTEKRTLEQVRLRGRWRCETSVRRYLKASRAMKEEGDLGKATLKYGQHVSDTLDAILSGREPAPAPPRLHAPILRAGKRLRRS